MEKWAKSISAWKGALNDGLWKFNLPNLSGRELKKIYIYIYLFKGMAKWAKSISAWKGALNDGLWKFNLPNLSGRELKKIAKGVTPEYKKLMPSSPMVS